jgi:predicted PurR-regulated permease PerM
MKSFDQYLTRDLVKLIFFFAALLGVAALFFISPALSTPTALSIVVTLLFSPLVASLERRGFSRLLSIAILFLTLGGGTTGANVWI